MAFGDPTMRRTPPGTRLPDPEIDTTARRPDPGAWLPTTIDYSPLYVGVDYISTDNVNLQSIIAEHISLDELSELTVDGGTITAGTFIGTTFQTSLSNPMLILDAAGLRQYNASGVALVSISSIGLSFASGFSTTVAWRTGGTVEASLYGDASGWARLSGRNVVMLGSGGTPTVPNSALFLDNGVGSVDLIANWGSATEVQLYLDGSSASGVQYLTCRPAGRVSLGNGAAVVDVLGNGGVVFQGTARRTCDTGGQEFMVGFRGPAVGASVAFGQGVTYPHYRSDVNGTPVTPPSFTFATAILNVNANTWQFRGITAYGASFTVNSTAAGTVDFLGKVTVN